MNFLALMRVCCLDLDLPNSHWQKKIQPMQLAKSSGPAKTSINDQ